MVANKTNVIDKEKSDKHTKSDKNYDPYFATDVDELMMRWY